MAEKSLPENSKGVVSEKKRKLLWCFLTALLCTVLFLLIWGAILIPGKLTSDNPRFNLRSHDVQGIGYWQKNSSELLRRVNITPGVNVFTLNVGEIRKHLLGISNIESAEVQIVLPDMLIFRINERVPRAIVNKNFVIDENGKIFKRSESAAADRTLPVISGKRDKTLYKEAVALIMTANRECRDIVIDKIDIKDEFSMTVWLTYRGDRQWKVIFPVAKESYSILFNKLQNAILHCALKRDNPVGFNLRYREYAIPIYD